MNPNKINCTVKFSVRPRGQAVVAPGGKPDPKAALALAGADKFAF